MLGPCDLLALSQSTPKQNEFFQEWGFLGVLVGAAAALFQTSRWFFTSKHREVDEASLSLEQIASATFVALVLKEARRVFTLVDDHLTEALSQEQSVAPAQSRFDRFCRALRSIPEEELGPRGRYTDVIRESFSRILSEVASRLLGAMDSHGVSTGNPILNPTGIRYSLERDGYLGFSEVSRFDSTNRAMERTFRGLWLASGILATMAGVCCAIAIVAVLYDDRAAQRVVWWCIWLGVGLALGCSLLFCLASIWKYKIIRRSKKFGQLRVAPEPPGESSGDR